MEDWAAAAADVAEGLAEAGQTVTLNTPGARTYDHTTGATTSSPTTTVTASGVVESYSAFSIDEDKVKTGDIKLLLSPRALDGSDVAPPVADKTTITLADGVTWRVVRNEPLAPAGVAVMHKVQLRR